MSSNDEVRHLRYDLDEVIHRTTDISQRLDKLEARYEQPAPSVEPRELASPPSVALAQVPQGEDAALRAQQAEELKRKPGTLRDAAKQGDMELAKRCIEEDANVNEVIGDESLLDVAVEAGQLEMVRFLVANGARIEHNALIGKSHVRRARYLGYKAMADFLAQASATKPRPIRTESISVPPDKTPIGKPVAAPDVWTMLSAGPIGRFVRGRIEEVRSRTRELGWEVQLGTYLLPRVAVVCIAIAVVFFLTLAIERWGAAWMPHLRVGIGYAVCAGLLVLAWRSEAKYDGLARVLYGGGFAVMYFVTFATHYVRFAQVFASPVPTLLLLTAIVVAWAIAAQVRQSKIIAVLVTGLGHLTVLLSTLTLDSPGPSSVMGLVVLSAGSAFFLLRNRWYYVASLGLVGSYVNDVVAMAHSRGGNPYTDFAGSMGVLAIFFLMFALAELFSPEEVRRKTIPGWFRNAFVTANTVAFVALGTVIVANFDFTRDYQDVFRFAVAAVLMVIGLGYLRLRAGDPLFNVYFVKAVALATLALATRYGGNTLSACLAVEMVVLLVSARQSGLVVMRLMAFGVACIAFAQSLGAVFEMPSMAYAAPGYFERVVQAVLGVMAFFVSSQLYQRTDWTVRSPRLAAFLPKMSAFCWKLDLMAERPAALKETGKPFGGLLFPYLYALAGTVLFVAYAFPLVQNGHGLAVLAGFALALTVSAAVLNSKPFGLAAVASLLLAALPVGSWELLHLETIDLPIVIVGLVAAGAAALASEDSQFGDRLVQAGRIGLAFHQRAVSPYILYGACAWLTGLLLVKEFQGVNGAFALAAAAVVSAGLVLVLHPTAFAAITGGFMLWASVVFLPEVLEHLHADPVRLDAAACILFWLSLLADRYFSFCRKRTPIAPYLCAGFVVNAIVVLLCYFEVSIPREWLMTAMALACYCFLAYAGLFRSPAAAGVSVAGVLYASFRHTVEAFNAASLQPSLVVAFALLAVFWIVAERLYVWSTPRFDETLDWVKLEYGWDLKRPKNVLAFIALATALLIVLLSRIPHLAHANLALITISWFALAAGLFVLSLVFRQRFYRYAGLAVIVLSLARLFLIDMKEQDPLLRVAAFAIVGAGLLCISVGYYKWMARTRAKDRNGADTTRS